MILSGKEIERLQGKAITIKPFSPQRVNPNSYNLRLYHELLIYEDKLLDMKQKPTARRITIPDTGYVLQPGHVYLGRTLEYTKTLEYVPMLEGRSSIGRLGILIHVTAGFGDVGFTGYWTLEIACIQPIRIYAGVEICQIYYHTVSDCYDLYSHGKYSNNHDIQISKLYQEFQQKNE